MLKLVGDWDGGSGQHNDSLIWICGAEDAHIPVTSLARTSLGMIALNASLPLEKWLQQLSLVPAA